MLTKTITYTDYNGVERTEKFYFNLTQIEVLELELDTPDGMENMIKTIMDSNDVNASIALVRKFLMKSYGVKSEDGKRLIKNDTVREEFEQTEAFSQLFIELITNADKAAEFFNGLAQGAAPKSSSPMPVKK